MLSDIQSIRIPAHIRMIKHVNERETEGRCRNNNPKKKSLFQIILAIFQWL